MNIILRGIFAVDRVISQLEKYLLFVMLMTMLVLCFLQVILRNFFNTGISWSDLLVRYLVLWLGFFGASLATRENRHLRIDTFNKILPKKLLPWVEGFVILGSLAVSSILCYASYEYVFVEESGKMLFGNTVPEQYLLVVIPLGFALISFRCVIKFLELLFIEKSK